MMAAISPSIAAENTTFDADEDKYATKPVCRKLSSIEDFAKNSDGLQRACASKHELLDKQACSYTHTRAAIPDYRSRINKLAFVVICFLGLFTRLYRLGDPPNVVWDEVHFGKFASYYLRREFFFDVHPPLGKLLYAGVGYLVGFDGSYLFEKIGQTYIGIDPDVPYFALRLAPALCGAFQVPLTFLTVIELGGNNIAALVASSLLLFDNGHVTQTRFILLDGFMITFILMAFYAYCCFKTQNRLYPFSLKWVFWLCVTGVNLALAASVKMVGLFVIAFVGISTAIGDSHMSRDFQSQLSGSPYAAQVDPMPQDIAYGSIITISPTQFKPNCWLHSHPHRWPLVYYAGTKKRRVGSAQQQVTCYPHKDLNNRWMVLENNRYTKYHHAVMNLTMAIEGGDEPHAYPRFVRHGDNIKLYHISTSTFLHTHDVASYGFPSKQEMSTWNGSDKVPPMTDWTIKFQTVGGEEGKRWHPFRTRFHLIHHSTQTTLEMSGERLPDFAFKQYELVSSKLKTNMDLFFVDSHTNDALESSSISGFPKPSFFTSTFELINEMISLNKQLTSKHVYQSYPWDWPILTRGISFYRDKENKKQLYMIPNPFGWYTAHGGVVVFLTLWIILTLRRARGCRDLSLAQWATLDNGVYMSMSAYALHYFPFMFMDRQLFLHHYLPASVFIYQSFGLFFGFILSHLAKPIKHGVVLLYMCALMYTFVMYSPLTFNFQSPWNLAPLKYKVAWDFSCFE
eukprot:CFRG7177T1